MRISSLVSVAVLLIVSPGQAAVHNIDDAFNFGVGGPANPNGGWTFANGAAAPLTVFTNDWNAPDFSPGQPGWEGNMGAHAGWAKLTDLNAQASGYDVVAGEVVTHGPTNVIYTPSSAQGDPFTGHHSVNISGTLHNVRALNRAGAWVLMRNNSTVLASGTVDDSTLSFNNGPLSLAQNATFVDSSLVTVSGNQITNVSYQPGDFFNLFMGNNDFVAVDLTIESLVAPGKGFGNPNVEKPQVAYYRFEEASGVDVMDSLSGQKHGEFKNTPAGMERSADVPAALIPQTGAANTKAADFRQGGSILFTTSEFIFNESTAGGADGSATLEWYMKVPNDNSPDIIGPNGHTSIFWTNGVGGSDSDRYNIFWDASFTGSPNSDRFVSGDFRATASGGGATPISTSNHDTGAPLTEDQWHHVAIVRTDNTPGDTTDFDFTWNWYFDGVLSPSQTATTNVGLPSQDVFGWTIAGRPNFPFRALIDEVRLTADALLPSEFLNATAAGQAGDFDNDGDVDGNDFLVWQRGGSPTPRSAGDLATWKANYGATAAAAAQPVPEPTAVLLAVAAAVGSRSLAKGRGCRRRARLHG